MYPPIPNLGTKVEVSISFLRLHTYFVYSQLSHFHIYLEAALFIHGMRTHREVVKKGPVYKSVRNAERLSQPFLVSAVCMQM